MLLFFLHNDGLISEFSSYNYYRPQRSCEGYVFTDVCLSTVGEDLTRYTPPGPGTPPRTRYTPDQVHPQTRYTPRAGTPPRTRYTPLRDTATAADGTHPTGMHSCEKNSHQVELEAVGLPRPRLSSCPVVCCSWRSSVEVVRWAFHVHWVFSSPAQATHKLAEKTVFFDHRIILLNCHLMFYGCMILRKMRYSTFHCKNKQQSNIFLTVKQCRELFGRKREVTTWVYSH